MQAGRRGLRAHKTYDEVRKAYSSRPEHDWSSHGASAFATGVLGYCPPVTLAPPSQQLPAYLTAR